MTRISNRMVFALALLVTGASAFAQNTAPGYHVVKKIALGGEGGWDYLACDGEARRLYIARANRIMVVDLDKGTLVGEVANTPGVHGVALVPKRDRGFTSNGGDSTVTVFDLKTLREVTRIPVGKRPDAIIYDSASNRIFTFNAGGANATAVDAETEKVVGSVALGGKPEFAVADQKGHVYVNIEDKNEVVEVDARNLTVTQRWPVSPGTKPTGLAMDLAKRRLFVTCGNLNMIILDADSGRVLATPAIGKGTDACVFDSTAGLAFSSNGDGTLTIVREDSAGQFGVAETVKTEAGARTMALDPKTHNILLVTARPKPGERRSYEPGSFVVLIVGK